MYLRYPPPLLIIALAFVFMAGCDALAPRLEGPDAAIALVEQAEAHYAAHGSKHFRPNFTTVVVVEAEGATHVVAEAGWATALDVKQPGLWVDRRVVYTFRDDVLESVRIAEYLGTALLAEGAEGAHKLWPLSADEQVLWYDGDYSKPEQARRIESRRYARGGAHAVAPGEKGLGTMCVVLTHYWVDTGEIISQHVLYCYDSGGDGPPTCTPESFTCGGGGGGPGAEPSPMPAATRAGRNIPEGANPPDCSKPQTEAWAIDYCNARAPEGERLNRTKQAIARIKARGGECANIADKAITLLSQGKLRYYPESADSQGGWGNSSIGAILLDAWVDNYFDTAIEQQDANGNIVRRNLDHTIVHEVEHTMGRSHIDQNAGGFQTPNSQACSGL